MPVVREVVDEAEGVFRYVLTNKSGSLSAKVINYGATLTHLITKDKNGEDRDVVLGFDDWHDYQGPHNRYLGATVGRYANRIALGKFQLNGQEYSLATNNGPNALHGGEEGFDKRLWEAEMVPVETHPAAVTFRLTSADGDQGYPGTLAVDLTYSVEEDGSLAIAYGARLKEDSEKDTIINLTNHSYFNLSGGLVKTILDHQMQLEADCLLPKDDTNIPTGEMSDVKDSPEFDFRTSHSIGEHMEQLEPKTGYDHCYVVRGFSESAVGEAGAYGPPPSPVLAATASCPTTGITMEFLTTEPGFQFYTAYYLSGEAKSKSSQPEFEYGPYSAFCLEAQRFPDAPNKAKWRGMAVLHPGKQYSQKTVYRFSASNKKARK